MGAGNVRLETESAVDTMDFVNKIVNQGMLSFTLHRMKDMSMSKGIVKSDC